MCGYCMCKAKTKLANKAVCHRSISHFNAIYRVSKLIYIYTVYSTEQNLLLYTDFTLVLLLFKLTFGAKRSFCNSNICAGKLHRIIFFR